jgi:hypothetical protein
VLISLVSSDYCGPWIAIDWTKMPMPSPTDTIEVRYLVAPLLYCSYKNFMTGLGGYHAGIAFVNKQKNYSFTLNYDAYPDFFHAIIPDVIRYPNGSRDLAWKNYGKVFVYEGINATYWHNANQVVGTMTGAQLTTFFNNFLVKANDSFPYYNLWRVYDHRNGKILLDNYSCFNFVWTCFIEIQQFGGTIVPNLHLNQSFGAAYSKRLPQKENYNDPVQRQGIIKFYEALEGKVKDIGIAGFFIELFEIFIDGVFYVRDSTDYYKIDVYYPFVQLVWIDIPVPYINKH